MLTLVLHELLLVLLALLRPVLLPEANRDLDLDLGWLLLIRGPSVIRTLRVNITRSKVRPDGICKCSDDRCRLSSGNTGTTPSTHTRTGIGLGKQTKGGVA